MATITKEFFIAASPEKIWDALSDFHAVHERVAPGFLTAARRDGDDRILKFFNGLVACERFVGRDDETRRIAYFIVDGRFAYHHACFQVFSDEAGSRVVWVTDILPNDLAESVRVMMGLGAEAMARTLAD